MNNRQAGSRTDGRTDDRRQEEELKTKDNDIEMWKWWNHEQVWKFLPRLMEASELFLLLLLLFELLLIKQKEKFKVQTHILNSSSSSLNFCCPPDAGGWDCCCHWTTMLLLVSSGLVWSLLVWPISVGFEFECKNKWWRETMAVVVFTFELYLK